MFLSFNHFPYNTEIQHKTLVCIAVLFSHQTPRDFNVGRFLYWCKRHALGFPLSVSLSKEGKKEGKKKKKKRR